MRRRGSKTHLLDSKLKEWLSALPSADTAQPTDVKLVINTYTGSRALVVLIHSLLAVAFDRFSDVVVVRGGGGLNLPPRRTSLVELTNAAITERHQIVLIDVERSNFDWHGLASLYKYRNHSLVRAHGYFYTLDSTTFLHEFPFIFNRFNFTNPRIVYTVALPNSNIAAFGAGVVEAFGRSFEARLSKQQGLFIEFNHGTVHGVRNLATWGEVVFCGERKVRGTRDMYQDDDNTNTTPPHPGMRSRVAVSYKLLGVIKHIRWGKAMPTCKAAFNCVPHPASQRGNAGLRMAHIGSWRCPIRRKETHLR